MIILITMCENTKTMIIILVTKCKNIETVINQGTKGKNIKTMMIKHSRPTHSRITWAVQNIFGYNSSGEQKTVFTEALGTNNT